MYSPGRCRLQRVRCRQRRHRLLRSRSFPFVRRTNRYRVIHCTGCAAVIVKQMDDFCMTSTFAQHRGSGLHASWAHGPGRLSPFRQQRQLDHHGSILRSLRCLRVYRLRPLPGRCSLECRSHVHSVHSSPGHSARTASVCDPSTVVFHLLLCHFDS